MCYKKKQHLLSDGKRRSREYLMGKWDKFQTWDTLVLEAIAKKKYRDAAEALVRGYLNVVVGFCTKMLGNKDLAEEVAQEVFIAAYQAMPRYQDVASLRTWVFGIARKKCWKVLRDRQNRQRLEDENRDVIAVGAHRDPPPVLDADVRRRRELACLQESLGKLTLRERDLVVTRYYAGFSLDAIARISWVSRATVRTRLEKAQSRLRGMIEECMGERA
jgi:RNA polymerase sigma-70 factor (ECF subfamily)